MDFSINIYKATPGPSLSPLLPSVTRVRLRLPKTCHSWLKYNILLMVQGTDTRNQPSRCVKEAKPKGTFERGIFDALSYVDLPNHSLVLSKGMNRW